MQTRPEEPNSAKCWRLQKEVAEMKANYTDAAGIIRVYTPDIQPLASKEWKRAYLGIAPTLETIEAGFGKDTAVVLLCVQLEDLNLFAGVKNKLSISKQKELAMIIMTEYGYLKISELLLFFFRLKCGRYGRFYGSVDALFISAALLQFIAERRKDLARIQEEYRRQTEVAQAPSSTAMTYAEYLEYKNGKLQKSNENDTL
jgi:hypothetical protein